MQRVKCVANKCIGNSGILGTADGQQTLSISREEFGLICLTACGQLYGLIGINCHDIN